MTTEINWGISDLTQQNFAFSNVESLKNFAKIEMEFWEKQWVVLQSYNISNQPSSVGVYRLWQQVYELLESWKENFKEWDQATTNAQLNAHFGQLSGQLTSRWIWSGQPFVDAWIGAYRLSEVTGNGFIQAYIQKNSANSGSFEWLKGYILAYEFQLQDESLLTKRRNGEEKAFSRLRTQLIEKKDELIAQSAQFQEQMTTWKTDTQEQFEGWFSNNQDDYAVWRQNQEVAYAADHKAHADKFDGHMDGWIDRISILEQTYHEKLKLEKPAQYWSIRAGKLRTQGIVWTVILAVMLLSGIGFFSYLFTRWLTGVEIALSLHSFQGAVLLTVIISSFVFLVRIASRLAFSAFHLQRDAEEREQLAYVYLALVNEAAADEESRKIVLQSLFSRAETGLLAGEAGPTMPGLSEAVSAVTKGTAR